MRHSTTQMMPAQLWEVSEGELQEAQERSSRRRSVADADRRLVVRSYQVGTKCCYGMR